MRSQSPKYRKANIEYIQKTIRLQTLGNKILEKPEKEITTEHMKEFMELLIDLTKKNRFASNQVEDATKRLLTEIEFNDIDFSEYFSKLKPV